MSSAYVRTSQQAFGPQQRRQATSAGFARNWTAMALRGALAIVFGLIAIFAPGVTMLSLTLVFGVFAIVDGVVCAIAAFRAGRNGESWGVLAALAAISLLVGVGALIWPGITVLAFVILIAARELVAGVLQLTAAFQLRHDHGRVWLGLSGLLSLLFGVLLAIAPFIGALVLTIWLGAYAIALGIGLLIFAYRLRERRNGVDSAARPTLA